MSFACFVMKCWREVFISSLKKMSLGTVLEWAMSGVIAAVLHKSSSIFSRTLYTIFTASSFLTGGLSCSNAVKFTETADRRELRVRIGALPAPEDDTLLQWPQSMDLLDLLPMCKDAPSDTYCHRIRLYVTVVDTGHGMSDKEQENLFQRFSQASPKTYGEFGGHGLGCEYNFQFSCSYIW